MAYFDHFKELAVELNTTGSEKLDTYLLRMLTSDVALPMSASGKEDLPLHKVNFFTQINHCSDIAHAVGGTYLVSKQDSLQSVWRDP